MSSRTMAADDTDAIASARIDIFARERAMRTRQCFGRLGLGTTYCWCFKAGENGESLPCPPVDDGSE